MFVFRRAGVGRSFANGRLSDGDDFGESSASRPAKGSSVVFFAVTRLIVSKEKIRFWNG